MAQFNYTIEQVRSAISFALHTVPVESLEALFAKFGYTADEICVDAAMAAWKRYGNEFFVPFSELANEVLSDEEQMAEIKKHWLSIDRGDGKKNSDGSTSTSTGSNSSSAWNSKTGEQKFDTIMNGVGQIFGMGMQGYATYTQIKNGQNQEETTTTTTTPTPEQTQSSFPWVAVGIGALVFILLIVLIVSMAKKK